MLKDLKTLIRTNHTILAIDNDMSSLMTLDLLLGSRGYNFIKANHSEEGLNLLLRNSSDIDLTLLDICVTGTSTAEFLSIIKSDHRLSHIPTILHGGPPGSYSSEQLEVLGAKGHISKPFVRTKVLEAIKKVFGKSPELKEVKPNINSPT